MAGKFMSLEEAARQLGLSIDEVHQLVDRKKLFPTRDGSTTKFKVDEIERVMRTLGEEASVSGDLDLDLPELALAGSAPALTPGTPALDADDMQLVFDDDDTGEDSIFGGSGPQPASPSGTGKGTGGAGSGKQDISGLSLSGPGHLSGADIMLNEHALGDEAESEDLALESIIGASSPSLGGDLAAPSAVAGTADSGKLDINLSGIGGPPSGLAGALSGLGGSGPGKAAQGGGSSAIGGLSGLSGPGGGLSGAGLGLSGVSLEGSGGLGSGLDLGDAGKGGGAEGDAFELGGSPGDDESASVVIASESEAGDSSFFGQAAGGQGSSFSEESVVGVSASSEALQFPLSGLDDMSFSVWQLCGLICCSLLMLFGGFIAYDLVRTIGSPESTTLSNPLLNAMAEAFGWRR